MNPTVVELLEFERLHPRHDGRKQEAVRLTFGLGFPRYFQILRRILLDPRSPEYAEALRHDPTLTHHLSDRWRAAMRTRSGLIRPLEARRW